MLPFSGSSYFSQHIFQAIFRIKSPVIFFFLKYGQYKRENLHFNSLTPSHFLMQCHVIRVSFIRLSSLPRNDTLPLRKKAAYLIGFFFFIFEVQYNTRLFTKPFVFNFPVIPTVFTIVGSAGEMVLPSLQNCLSSFLVFIEIVHGYTDVLVAMFCIDKKRKALSREKVAEVSVCL